jgi:PIN domain nuclease of toxin-antitoxin system
MQYYCPNIKAPLTTAAHGDESRVAKLGDRGMPANEARAAVEATGLELVDFTADQACVSGDLRARTRTASLSLGDRVCLALARTRNLPAFTADAAWTRVSDVDIVMIRQASRHHP